MAFSADEDFMSRDSTYTRMAREPAVEGNELLGHRGEDGNLLLSVVVHDLNSEV